MKLFKLVLIFTLIFAISGIFSGIALAERGYVKMGSEMMWGRPYFYTDSKIAYYIWRTENLIHVRWSSDGDTHLFRGTIISDVPIYNIVGVRAEAEDYIIRVSKREIGFSGTTSVDVDGFSFQVENPTEIRIAMRVDGVLIEPSCIYMGKDNAHPTGNPVIFYKP